MRRALVVLTLAMVSVLAGAETALAKTATLTVSQTWSSNASGVADTFEYEVVPADTESDPLEGSGADGAYRFSMRRSETKTLSFPLSNGHYELRCVSGAPSGAGWSVFGGPYAVEVVEDAAGGFCALVIDEDGSKSPSASFAYRYRAEVVPERHGQSVVEFLPSTGDVSLDALRLALLGMVMMGVGVFYGRKS